MTRRSAGAPVEDRHVGQTARHRGSDLKTGKRFACDEPSAAYLLPANPGS
jgi:hypothetical protein